MTPWQQTDRQPCSTKRTLFLPCFSFWNREVYLYRLGVGLLAPHSPLALSSLLNYYLGNKTITSSNKNQRNGGKYARMLCVVHQECRSSSLATVLSVQRDKFYASTCLANISFLPLFCVHVFTYFSIECATVFSPTILSTTSEWYHYINSLIGLYCIVNCSFSCAPFLISLVFIDSGVQVAIQSSSSYSHASIICISGLWLQHFC